MARFHPLLEYFARDWAELANTIRRRVEKLDDASLERLIADCEKPTETNCWYAIYHVAAMIKPEARLVQGVRAEDG